MNRTWLAIIVVSAVLGFIYLGMLLPARSGYGYTGYRGHYGSPSFFYFGSSRGYYGRPSVRGGSVSGPGQTGRGLSGGK